MAKGKFSNPRFSRDDQSLPAEPEIPGLSDELAQELLLDELTQDVFAWDEVPAPPEDETEVVVVLPESTQPEEEPEVVVVLPEPDQPEEETEAAAVLPEPTQPEDETEAAALPDPIQPEEEPDAVCLAATQVIPPEPEQVSLPTEIPTDPEPELFTIPDDPEVPEEPQQQEEPEDPEISPRVKKHRKIALISLCSAALLILGGVIAAVSILMTRANDDGLILNNVTVAGVNLGGMTLEQAEQVLQIATKDTYTQQDMVINLPGATITLSPAQTGAKLDVAAAAKAAYDYGRTGSRAEREAAKQQSLTGPYHIALLSYMELDTDYIRQMVEEYCAGFNSEFSESSYAFQGQKPALSGDAFNADAPCQTLLLNPGTPGQNLDVDALYNRILDSYSFNTFLVEVDNSILGDMPTPLDLDAIFLEYCSEPVDARFDPNTKEVVPEVYGYTFDLERAKELLAAAEPGTVVGVPMEYVEPARIGADFFADVLSSYETKHTNSENRNTNLRLACAAINGYILLPGDTFDYNQTLGKRTVEAGYKAAGAYANGETVYEIGGGICQVSSTLYYCTLLADLEIVTREAHSYVSNYMPYGMDATVSWNGPDFRFRNNTDYPIRIEAEVADGYVKVKLVGTDTKDYYVEMEYEIIGWEAYETVYEEYAPDNEKGYTDGQVITTPYTGCTVKTYRCRYDKETQELISRDFEARSKYKSRDEVIAKIVTTPTEDTQAPTEDSKPTEDTQAPTENTGKPTEESTEATTAPTEGSAEPSTEGSQAASGDET